MTQVLITASLLLILMALMSVGMVFKGRPLRRSCGGIGGDDKECPVCDGGTRPEECREGG